MNSIVLGYEPAKKYINHENIKNNLQINGKNNEIMLKIVMIGSSNSGKTTFVNKLSDKYNFSFSNSTTGFDTCEIVCQNEKNENFLVTIIDSSGTERYKSMIKLTLRDASLAIIMFNLNNIESFVEVDDWITFFICNKFW